MCEGSGRKPDPLIPTPLRKTWFSLLLAPLCVKGLEENQRNLRERYVRRERAKERFKGEQRVQQYQKFHIYEEGRGENKQDKKGKRETKKMFQEGNTWKKFPEEKKSCGKDESVVVRVRSLLNRIRTWLWRTGEILANGSCVVWR
jgi:hypothetical protein